MFGQHEGLSPLVDKDTASKAALKALGRLKAGGDVASRRKILDTAFASVKEDDRFWLETLVGEMTDAGLDSIPAHLAALAAGWSVADGDIAAIVREANTSNIEDAAGQAVIGIRAAVPEFARRMDENRINSDEVFLRVAFVHLFRRDPSSQVQMFVLDGLARGLSRAMKMDVQEFTSNCLERLDEVDVPDSAWGYVILLRALSARGGFFLPEPTDAMRKNVEMILTRINAEFDLGVDEGLNHLAAAAYSGFLLRGDQGTFGSMMAAALEREGMRYAVLYVRDDAGEGGGVHSRVLEIPASSVAEAREKALKLPEIRAHDDFRRLAEQVAQMSDAEDVEGRA